MQYQNKFNVDGGQYFTYTVYSLFSQKKIIEVLFV